MYSTYKQARDTAWQALIDCGISSLPVPLKPIAQYAGAVVVDNAEINALNDNQLGCLAVSDGKAFIVIDRSVSMHRQRYTIAHELGHILCGHVLQEVMLSRRNAIIYTQQEYQAERFAIDLLAPACVLWGLNLHTPAEISKACSISMQSAAIRANRMEELYRRGRFLASPLEQQVYKQFKSFIEFKR